MISLDAMPVPMAGGYCAWVDAQDQQDALTCHWSRVRGRSKTNFYARCSKRGEVRLLHRLIAGKMGIGNVPEIDHKDGIGINCTRANLRAANRQQNHCNQPRRNGGRFKGVAYKRDKRGWGAWYATIDINRRSRHLGCFPSAEAAARVYDSWAREAWGDFAYLNFPLPESGR